MKDIRKIRTCLRAFQEGLVDAEFVAQFMLDIFSNSTRFNWHNFILGFTIGGILGVIVREFLN